MNLYELIDGDDLDRMIAAGYVRQTKHPTEPLWILNYTPRCQYDRAWNDVTRQCRGLIWTEDDLDLRWVVARPWPKFHNYGEHEEGTLDLDAAVEVTDKLDGSLGILYPTSEGPAIATRGSFTSEQATVGRTLLLPELERGFVPIPGFTYLFEIVYPRNRIVVDYAERSELVLLGVVDIETGLVGGPSSNVNWTGPTAEILPASTLREALELEPRPNAEGIVVRHFASGALVKIKQDDYVALHRILTGTNARNVWEVAAVHACASLIEEAKHWGSFLGIDPARAEEVLALGEAWLDGVPDEFHSWVRDTIEAARATSADLLKRADVLVFEARGIADRRTRYEHVHAAEHPAEREILRIADGRDEERDRLVLRCWREATPAPTAPFARDEDVA